jgi:uncharacterized protein (UPF0276 family)
MRRFGLPDLGVGVGLRAAHYAHLLAQDPAVDWLEVVSDHFLYTHGRPLYVLEQLAERYPVALHGASLSIGSTAPLDLDHLRELKSLHQRVRAHWISDHLCWTGIAGRNTHELLPLPYTAETLRHTVARVRQVQDCLGERILLENPASYCEFTHSTMSEAQFLAALAEEADCGILLDVNNVYVSAFNHGFDALAYLSALPFERVAQVHVAGHTHHGTHLIDSHAGPVDDAVWALWREVELRAPGVSVLLEWDAELPSFERMHAEALLARDHVRAAALAPELRARRPTQALA